MPESLPEFDTLVQKLVDSGVRFVLIGGLAMVAHGSAQVTRDVVLGFARDRDNFSALVHALEDLHPRLRVGADGELPFLWGERTVRLGLNFTLRTDAGAIDLLGEVPGVGTFNELWERAIIMSIWGREVRVASLADLIAMKKAAGREKDRIHLMELEAIQRLISESDVSPT